MGQAVWAWVVRARKINSSRREVKSVCVYMQVGVGLCVLEKEERWKERWKKNGRR